MDLHIFFAAHCFFSVVHIGTINLILKVLYRVYPPELSVVLQFDSTRSTLSITTHFMHLLHLL